MTDYVLGIIISEDKKILLVKKLKGPKVNLYKWNGVGGKIEKDETPHEAMKREVFEESGLDINDWDIFCELIMENDFKVYVGRTFVNKINYKQKEEEPLDIFDSENIISNDQNIFARELPYVVQMAFDPYIKSAKIKYDY